MGFLKKGPQEPQKRSKINSNGIFGYWGPKWATKTFRNDNMDRESAGVLDVVGNDNKSTKDKMDVSRLNYRSLNKKVKEI